VASTFKDAAARERQARIDELEKDLSQMEYAYSYSSSDSDSATLDSDIQRLIHEVSVYAARREYSFADGASEQLKPYILRRFITSEDAETLWARISDTRSTLNTLYAEAKAESGSIKAQTAGYFSSVTDGLEEELTPDFLMNAMPGQFQAYENRPLADTGAVGKLVTSIKWYYACVVQTDSLRNLREGDRVEVSFAYDFPSTIRMRVERISRAEGDNCLLVLSSDQYIQNAVTTRRQSADLIFDTKSGLRVPKTAIYVVDGESGVYVLEGAEARFKPVTILYDNGESFVVALDKSSTKNLWPEDEIILTTEELFEGKVMIK
jgi:putative membrane fusion protein